MAESFVDSFKTELITDRVWVSLQALELAIVEYVGWFNLDRLHGVPRRPTTSRVRSSLRSADRDKNHSLVNRISRTGEAK
jgi:hypothetical protein